MPLPDRGDNRQWPPLAYEQVYRDMEVYNAWFAGDIDALETLYSTTRLIRRSGLWGQAKRFFFGTPVPGQQTQRPVKLHVPIASEISRMSSQLLYGEMPKVSFETMDSQGNLILDPSPAATQANARVSELLDDSAHAAFLEAGEVGSALGGSFLRVIWDRSIVPDAPFITAVAQDAAVPEFRFGRMTAVTFWSELPPLEDPIYNTNVYRLLERHEPGRIEYGLYTAANQSELGRRVPLTDHPSSAPLAAMVDDQSGVNTGTTLLTAVYVPNVKPTRMMRKDPTCSQYGRSDYEGVDDLFDAFDEVYTSWMRDIRLAKSRIFVSRDLIDTGQPGQGGYFDADREVYVPLKSSPSSVGGKGAVNGGGSYVQAEQFKIRYQEHQQSAEEILRQIFTAAGYSPQTFGLADQHTTRSITATQVQFQERMSNMTRGAKLLYAKPQLQHLIMALLDVDKFVFGGPGRADLKPDIEFPDVAAPSLDAMAASLQLLRAAEAASTKTLVAMLNPDWTPPQIAEEVELIKAETPKMAPLPDPNALQGDNSVNGNSPDSEPLPVSTAGDDLGGTSDF